MDTAKLFKKGRSQAVSLPEGYSFSGDKVFIKKIGDIVLLVPEDKPWQPLFESLELFTEDFMAEREQPPAHVI
ncbi:MAG: type II toxin-antitoxin system VapB family antitoxin [Chloroflexia bacterium]